MPFQSEKQRKYLHANHPEIAKRWEKEYATGGVSNLFRKKFEKGTYRKRLQKDYESLTKGADWMRTAPPKWWLFPEKYGMNRDDAMTFFKERFMYGDLDPIPTPWEAIKKSPELVKFKEWLEEREEHASGGISNLFKLKEGGRTGFFTGAQADTASGKSMSPGTSASGGTRSGGDGGYQNVHQTGAVTQTPGRTTTTPDKGDGNIKKGPQEGWTEDEVKKAIKEGERKKELRDLALQGQKTETWEKTQTWNKPTITPGSVGVNLLTTFLTGGISNPWTKAAANRVVKWGANKIGVDNMINTFVDEKFGSIDEMKSKIEARVAKEDLIQSLPKGHPERIQLEESVKTKTTPKEGPNGEGGVTQDTSIKIENIEEVNDDKTQLLRKYQEMNDASRLAWQRQQEDRSKQMAYWKQLMAPYMAAQGGRVPAGYNTGGLSNLFRLKNV